MCEFLSQGGPRCCTVTVITSGFRTLQERPLYIQNHPLNAHCSWLNFHVHNVKYGVCIYIYICINHDIYHSDHYLFYVTLNTNLYLFRRPLSFRSARRRIAWRWRCSCCSNRPAHCRRSCKNWRRSEPGIAVVGCSMKYQPSY